MCGERIHFVTPPLLEQCYSEGVQQKFDRYWKSHFIKQKFIFVLILFPQVHVYIIILKIKQIKNMNKQAVFVSVYWDNRIIGTYQQGPAFWWTEVMRWVSIHKVLWERCNDIIQRCSQWTRWSEQQAKYRWTVIHVGRYKIWQVLSTKESIIANISHYANNYPKSLLR